MILREELWKREGHDCPRIWDRILEEEHELMQKEKMMLCFFN